MLARREALLGAGLLDERFFIYSEEPDLCLRLLRAGWRTVHLPTMTIVHHAGKGGVRPRMVAQDAFTRKQYAQKHFSAPRRSAYLTAVFARHAIRAVVPAPRLPQRREGAKLAMRTLIGREGPPFGAPPPNAVRPPAVRRGGASS
jgi:GT2 family glycosyltransferase